MAKKQGEVDAITQKLVHGSDQGDVAEFKGPGEEVKKEVKKTSILTMRNSKPTWVYFEDGKEVKSRVAV